MNVIIKSSMQCNITICDVETYLCYYNSALLYKTKLNNNQGTLNKSQPETQRIAAMTTQALGV
jgi:hypothetical protein